jgi:hypothetical protein
MQRITVAATIGRSGEWEHLFVIGDLLSANFHYNFANDRWSGCKSQKTIGVIAQSTSA